MKTGSGLLAVLAALPVLATAEAVDIGGRRELFVDNAVIGRTSGELRLVLHRPQPRETVFKTDKPWEGNTSAYQSVFKADGKYRMYYRGWDFPDYKGEPARAGVLCYAESTDGIHWVRPNLGICEFQKSKENNIILDQAAVQSARGDLAHTFVFYDTNPACPDDQRYKAVIVGWGGLHIWGSGDGLHFRALGNKPCVTDGAFDSQNLIFWDSVAKTYRAYYRIFRDKKVRDILTAASGDILKFPPGKRVARSQGQEVELYTNQMQPYYRAPHIILGFPMRYHDRGKNALAWPAMQALPGLENRKIRYSASPRYGTVVTDAVLLASRDGESVRLWEEAFMRPGPRMKESWVYGDNFIFWGMLELPAVLEDAPNEISFYSTESYCEGEATKFRRSTLRLDGFVSAQATAAGGELVTKPLIFEGNALSINFETGGSGELKAELQKPDGTPIPGFALADCFPIFGDHIGFPVSWKGKGTDVSALTGKAVCIRFTLKDADLYAFQFTGQ